MRAERLFPETMILGEGPVYDEKAGVLHWVDITAGQLWRHDFGENLTTHRDFGQSVGMCCLTEGGGVVAALKKSLVLVGDGGERVLIDGVEPEAPDNRFNDGKPDPAGRLLVGTMDEYKRPGLGALYCLEEGKGFKKLLGGVSISNGLAFSPDSRVMYYVDTPSGALWRFDYDLDTGEISNHAPLIDYTGEEGRFDGITVDAEGCIWAAHWGGSQVSRWDPATGRKLLSLRLPVPYVTCCCFGGPGLKTLFITTAWDGDERVRQEHPLSGALFACRTDTQGLPAGRFR